MSVVASILCRFVKISGLLCAPRWLTTTRCHISLCRYLRKNALLWQSFDVINVPEMASGPPAIALASFSRSKLRSPELNGAVAFVDMFD